MKGKHADIYKILANAVVDVFVVVIPVHLKTKKPTVVVGFLFQRCPCYLATTICLLAINLLFTNKLYV